MVLAAVEATQKATDDEDPRAHKATATEEKFMKDPEKHTGTSVNPEGDPIFLVRAWLRAEGTAHFREIGVRIDGKTSGTKRQEAVDRFQSDPQVQVFLGQIKAAGVGITLTEARSVIRVDRPWTPAEEDQAADRAYRIGQTGVVNVYDLDAEGTFDGDLGEVLQVKRTTISAFEKGAMEVGEDGDPDALDTVSEILKRLKKAARSVKRKADKATRTSA